jgi:D-alanyl-D-alanine-carboxypeptidase/D-alanyl-D-alanine-endopeptidase
MRSLFTALLFTLASVSAADPAATTATALWEIPSNDEIRRILVDRFRMKGAAMVVGVIEPAGRRVVAYGESGSRDRRSVSGDTIFQIGSVTKVFTTLLLADMVERGEVTLDDPASMYLPRGVVMLVRGRPIKLRDLATHMSGLPSMPDNLPLRGEPDPLAAYTPAQLHRFLSTYRLERSPGERWAYSNLGVALLGRLLARRAGESYESLLTARVLEPLGLHSTAISLSREQAARLAPGHDRYGEPAVVWEMRTLQGSGSLRSSANDLLAFLSYYIGEQQTLLRGAMDLQLSVRSPVKDTQALGWSLGRFDGREIFVHDGGKPGYRALLAFDPSNCRGVVILVSARTDERLGAFALYLLTGRKLPPPRDAVPARPRIKIDRRALSALEGRYQLENGHMLSIIGKDGSLIVGTEGEGPSLFVPADARNYFDSGSDEELSFTDVATPNGATVVWYEHGKGMPGVLGTRLPKAVQANGR